MIVRDVLLFWSPCLIQVRSFFVRSRPPVTRDGLAASRVVRSWAGTTSKVHTEQNHLSWLELSFFLFREELSKADAAQRGGVPACGGVLRGVAAPSAVPHGNHGENNVSITVHAGVNQ